MKYVDTHAHLNLSAFDGDRAEIVAKCQEEGVTVFNVGTKESTSKTAVEMADEYDNCFAIVGLHPIQTIPAYHDEAELGDKGLPFVSKGEGFDKEFYRELCTNEKVIAIGECGLDYFHTTADTYEVQETAFIAQIELANELNLPLMIHTRGPQKGKDSPTGRSVYADVYDILKQHAKTRFNVHFYAGTYEEAQKFFDIGGTISFTGVVTFAKDYEEVIKNTPLGLMFAETDCPYVAPVPHRGKRCEPWMVKEVYKKIAELKGISEEEVVEKFIENIQKFYNIPM